jgi:uridine kinase
MEWKYANHHLESHTVTTEDGYILTLSRLVSSSSSNVQNQKKDKTDTSFEVENIKKEESAASASLPLSSEECETKLKAVSSTKPAVLLVHGFLGSSDQYFELPPEQTLRKIPKHPNKTNSDFSNPQQTKICLLLPNISVFADDARL